MNILACNEVHVKDLWFSPAQKKRKIEYIYIYSHSMCAKKIESAPKNETFHMGSSRINLRRETRCNLLPSKSLIINTYIYVCKKREVPILL